ncbi:MAG: phenol hydroxylase subunit P4 [Magnetospiraceae bacterium]
MSVKSLKPYAAAPRDLLENYHGNQLVYASWDQHLLFAAPFITCTAPEMTFGAYVEEILKPLVSPDPDAAQVDWKQVQWLKGHKPWTPNFEASLAENGVVHKDHIRMQTPGLNSLMPVDG